MSIIGNTNKKITVQNNAQHTTQLQHNNKETEKIVTVQIKTLKW